MKKRINQILELLTKYEKIEVAALAEQLNVSQVTIRKDLDNLEQERHPKTRTWVCNSRYNKRHSRPPCLSL